MEVLLPFIMAKIIDEGIEKKQYEQRLYVRRTDDRSGNDKSYGGSSCRKICC